ncbi:MAG: acyltransferase [Terracidiphilus sp.]
MRHRDRILRHQSFPMLMLENSAWRNPRLSGRIPELDGVRGLAILLVVVFHYFVQSTQVTSRWINSTLWPLHLMVSGVDLFFVLSGFLIGGILYDARFAKNYYSTFYGRRVYRIFPVYFLWLMLFLLGLHLIGPHNATYLHRLFNRDVPFWLYPLFLQNVFTAFRHQWGAEWISATWSLAVEEQFYLLLPFAIRVSTPRGILRMAVGAILLHNWTTFCVTCLALVITLACAAISWRFLEHPLIRHAVSRYRYVNTGQ